MTSEGIPLGASAAILRPSDPIPEGAVPVIGPNFEQSPNLTDLLGSYERIGFQATSLGRAMQIVEKMVSQFQAFRHLYEL